MKGPFPSLRFPVACLLIASSVLSFAHAAEKAGRAEVAEVRKIWGRAPHNAFTDLIRFKDRWYCTFREGTAHVSPDGALRILTSSDGEFWSSAALLSSSRADLRDPKLTITPGNRLMLTAAGALHKPAPIQHQSMAWFSHDGREWGEPHNIGDPDTWLWRVTWHMGAAYSIGYRTTGSPFIRLYASRDGERFDTLVDNLYDRDSPSETSIVFLDDHTALCLLRRDAPPATAQLGSAKPPYRAWTWKDLGVTLGGPHMVRLPDGRIVAAGRRRNGKVHTALCWLDPEEGKLTEFLALPSAGDTSYAGLVWHDGLLWVSYYSSHEGKTSIYLAKVKLPAVR